MLVHAANGRVVEVAPISQRLPEIAVALQILEHSPLSGRPVKGGKRELVIGRGLHRHVALYRFVIAIDTVFVLAVRRRRESGHRQSP
jgi:hypothetical protein